MSKMHPDRHMYYVIVTAFPPHIWKNYTIFLFLFFCFVLFLFFIAKKVTKHSNNTPVAKNILFLCARRFLHGINPWSGVKAMVLWVISGKNKVGHFRHFTITFQEPFSVNGSQLAKLKKYIPYMFLPWNL